MIEDGPILAAVTEERTVRIKPARGFPWKAIEEVLRLSNTAAHGIKAAAQVNMEFREPVADWPGWFEGDEDSARFMTITFHCTPSMIKRCGSVVHVDNTARSQLVRKQDKKSHYNIISEYHRRKDIADIIKISFNIHEEPIVRSPHDAVRAFLDSALDYLVIGDFIVEEPVGSAATRKT